MRTTLDVVDDIYSALKSGSFKSAITGDIYKHKRLLDSRKEDVVINSLPISNQQLQTGIANVNIHVADIPVTTGSGTDNHPNHVRLKELAGLAIAELEVWSGDYHFDVQQQTIIQEETGNEHFVNIRVNYYSINL